MVSAIKLESIYKRLKVVEKQTTAMAELIDKPFGYTAFNADGDLVSGDPNSRKNPRSITILLAPAGKFMPPDVPYQMSVSTVRSDGWSDANDPSEDGYEAPESRLKLWRTFEFINAPERSEQVYREDPAQPTPVESQPHKEGEWSSDKQRDDEALLAMVRDWQAQLPEIPRPDLAEFLPESAKKVLGENVGTTMASPLPAFTGAARFGPRRPAQD